MMDVEIPLSRLRIILEEVPKLFFFFIQDLSLLYKGLNKPVIP